MATRFTCQIAFHIDGVDQLLPGDRSTLRAFIKEALENWGGQRHPEDWLFGGLERVAVSTIEVR